MRSWRLPRVLVNSTRLSDRDCHWLIDGAHWSRHSCPMIGNQWVGFRFGGEEKTRLLQADSDESPFTKMSSRQSKSVVILCVSLTVHIDILAALFWFTRQGKMFSWLPAECTKRKCIHLLRYVSQNNPKQPMHFCVYIQRARLFSACCLQSDSRRAVGSNLKQKAE